MYDWFSNEELQTDFRRIIQEQSEMIRCILLMEWAKYEFGRILKN